VEPSILSTDEGRPYSPIGPTALDQRFRLPFRRPTPRALPRAEFGKWVKARYVAERHEIAERHEEFEIIGPPEIRDVDPAARYFTPWKVVPHADLMRIEELAPELDPHLAQPPAMDDSEAFLVGLFLRRYVTYCIRRGRYAQMNGAARLLATLRTAFQQPPRPRYPVIDAS
jgi:hypothetical protein